jgi:hypothetical protein
MVTWSTSRETRDPDFIPLPTESALQLSLEIERQKLSVRFIFWPHQSPSQTHPWYKYRTRYRRDRLPTLVLNREWAETENCIHLDTSSLSFLRIPYSATLQPRSTDRGAIDPRVNG